MKLSTRIAITLISLLLTIACSKDSGSNPEAANKAPPPQGGMTGTGVGNGGGAIFRNGNYLTFAQAGITLEVPVAEVDLGDHVAEVKIVEDMINKLALSAEIRSTLLRAILPDGVRKYFRIKAKDLDPKKRQQLMAAYYSVLKEEVPPNEVALVAITIAKETYLLPEFENLSDSKAKASILFHEALWVRNPNLKLSEVIRGEVAFEKLLRADTPDQQLAYDSELFQILKVTFEEPFLPIVGSIRKDLEKGPITLKIPTVTGAETKTLSSPVISAKDILGEATVEQLRFNPMINRSLLYGHFYDLTRLNPNVRFIKEMAKELDKLEVIFIDYRPYNGWAINNFERNAFYDPSLNDREFNLTLPVKVAYVKVDYGPTNPDDLARLGLIPGYSITQHMADVRGISATHSNAIVLSLTKPLQYGK